MKREITRIIKEAIEMHEAKTRSDLKWKTGPRGLHWDYLDSMFNLIYNNEFVKIYDDNGDLFKSVYYSADDEYADAKTLNDAIRIAVIFAIRKAEYLY